MAFSTTQVTTVSILTEKENEKREKRIKKIVILNVGDTITFVVDKNATGDIVTVKNVK